jgi:hypothetical protein
MATLLSKMKGHYVISDDPVKGLQDSEGDPPDDVPLIL